METSLFIQRIPWNIRKSYLQLHRSPNIIKYFLFVTHKCILHVSDMLHLRWLWYWHSWSHCVRNDPVLDQIPWHMENSYVQLHRSSHIIKYFLFATHKCVYMFPICYFESGFDIDTLDDIEFEMIHFWIKYLEKWWNHIYSFIEVFT